MNIPDKVYSYSAIVEPDEFTTFARKFPQRK